MRRLDSLVTRKPNLVLAARRALAADADADGAIDQHQPPNVVSRPDLPICHGRSVGPAIGWIEVDEDPVRLLVECGPQGLHSHCLRMVGWQR